MKPSEYFPDKVETCLTCLSDRALNAVIVFDAVAPYTAKDHQCALEAWLQGRHDRRNRMDACKANPTNENLVVVAELAIHEHTPHTQGDYDDIVERAYRLAMDETPIENELERRRNNGER